MINKSKFLLFIFKSVISLSIYLLYIVSDILSTLFLKKFIFFTKKGSLMFSERLKELRKNMGYTQKEIAEQIGTSQPSYQNWEKGSRKPSRETIQKLADFFNVSTDYLLGQTDIPNSTLEADIDTAIDNSVAYDGTPITDNDREIIKNFLKDYFSNKK